MELIATLGAKPNAAHGTARVLADAEETADLSLGAVELRYCQAVISNSTFEARYAGLVLGIKEKLAGALEADSATPAK